MALRPCLTKRCPTLTRERYCATCAPLQQQVKHSVYDSQRGTSTERGYDSRWRKYRTWFLSQHPLCGQRDASAIETADSRCQQSGRIKAATVVDHIVPVSGPNDPEFYAIANHQAMCDGCHNAKRQRESQQAARRSA